MRIDNPAFFRDGMMIFGRRGHRRNSLHSALCLLLLPSKQEGKRQKARSGRTPVAAIAMLAALLLAAGCGGEPRAPFQAGGRQVKDWVGDLKSPKATVRRQAVHKLGNVGDADPAAAEALAGALRDPDALVRHDAVLGVLKLEKPGEAIGATLDAMAKSDKDPKVRDIAQKAVTKLGRGG